MRMWYKHQKVLGIKNIFVNGITEIMLTLPNPFMVFEITQISCPLKMVVH